MELKVTRSVFTDTTTLGKLYVDDDFYAFTCEDVIRDLTDGCSAKVQDETAISYGKYKVIVNYSNHFKKERALLLDVDCFEGIRIHGGNTNEDTEGCILIGAEGDMQTRIWNCAEKVEQLTSMIKAKQVQEDVWIMIEKG